MKAAILALSLSVALIIPGQSDLAKADAAGKVAGSIRVTGTKVKTEGSKSQKEVVVYLEKAQGADYPPPAAEHAKMDQQNLVFIPHVMAVQKGTTVDFLNTDTVDHNIFCVDDCCKILEGAAGAAPQFMDLGNWGKGEVRNYTFKLTGEAVLLCKLHPEMAAYLLVLDTPYFQVVELDGTTQSATYSIANIPPGDYVVKVWNKKCKTAAEQKVAVTSGQTTKADLELVRKK